MLSANFRPCRWFNATVTGSATNYGLGWGWLLNFTPKGVTLFFGSDYMVTRVTPQWIPTGPGDSQLQPGHEHSHRQAARPRFSTGLLPLSLHVVRTA